MLCRDDLEIKYRAAVAKTERTREELAQRKQYLESIGIKPRTNVEYILYMFQMESLSREVQAIKEALAKCPKEDPNEVIRRKMWQGMSEPEKLVLKKIKEIIGNDKFSALCKEAYDEVKAKDAQNARPARRENEWADDEDTTSQAIARMMINNRNDYISRRL